MIRIIQNYTVASENRIPALDARQAGSTVYVIASNKRYQWDGAAWVVITAIPDVGGLKTAATTNTNINPTTANTPTPVKAATTTNPGKPVAGVPAKQESAVPKPVPVKPAAGVPDKQVASPAPPPPADDASDEAVVSSKTKSAAKPKNKAATKKEAAKKVNPSKNTKK